MCNGAELSGATGAMAPLVLEVSKIRSFIVSIFQSLNISKSRNQPNIQIM